MRKIYTTMLVLFGLITLVAAAQTSATRPQTSSPAQTSPPSASGQNPSQGQARSVDDELQLTPDQKQKIAAIVDDEDKQIAAVREDSSLSTSQKVEKARQIHQVAVPKIRALLTPDQLQKLAAIQERKEREEQNQSAPQR